MDQRRYYVLGSGSGSVDTLAAASGEQGPYSLEELREALHQGSILGTNQVRTGLGTMIGIVQDVVNEADAPHGAEASGSRPSLAGSAWVVSVTALVVIAVAGYLLIRPSADRSVGPPTPVSPAAAAPSPADPARTAAATAPVDRVPIRSVPQADPATGSRPSVPTGALELTATSATLEGKLRLVRLADASTCIEQWIDQRDQVSWTATFTRSGRHEVMLEYACPTDAAGSQYRITVGGRSMANRTEGTVDAQTFALKVAGFIHINQPGDVTVSIRRLDKRETPLMRLRRIIFTAK